MLIALELFLKSHVSGDDCFIGEDTHILSGTPKRADYVVWVLTLKPAVNKTLLHRNNSLSYKSVFELTYIRLAESC